MHASNTRGQRIEDFDAAIAAHAGAAVPDGIALPGITRRGTTAISASSLPLVPTRSPLPGSDPVAFAEATALEFAKAEPRNALASYRALASQSERAVRAGTLARLAPLHVRVSVHR